MIPSTIASDCWAKSGGCLLRVVHCQHLRPTRQCYIPRLIKIHQTQRNHGRHTDLNQNKLSCTNYFAKM